MVKEYDGWAIKTKEGKLLRWSFCRTRTELVQEIAGEDYWRIQRRKGQKIVKVNLVEVE